MSIFGDLNTIKNGVQTIKECFAPEVRVVKQEPLRKPRYWFYANNCVVAITAEEGSAFGEVGTSRLGYSWSCCPGSGESFSVPLLSYAGFG